MVGIASWLNRGQLTVVVATGVALALVACGSGGGPATGTERGPCYGNGTCNAGLECLSNLCVRPATGGTAGATGAAGSSGTGGTLGAAGTGGSAGTAGNAGTSGVGGMGGAAATGGGAPSCTSYCTAVTNNCTGTAAQYTNLAECQAVCPDFPVGTSADISGNTLGCRIGHATAGASAADCAAAGPSGGAVCGTDPCVPYCALMRLHCTGAYSSVPACMSACASFQAGSGNYSSDATSLTSHSVYCYLGFAALAAVDPTLHCPHAVANATTCGQ